MANCACDNCDWIGDEDDVNAPSDLWERLSPGSVVPSGECPECGALCYPLSLRDSKISIEVTTSELSTVVNALKAHADAQEHERVFVYNDAELEKSLTDSAAQMLALAEKLEALIK